jgi:ATP-dependent RNA helicase DeaD
MESFMTSNEQETSYSHDADANATDNNGEIFAAFSELPIPKELKDALVSMNYVTPTPIQAQAILRALKGLDIIGSAQTGTGKTLAFALPLVAFLLANPAKNALVLLPTRELAEQVKQVLQALTAKTPQLKSSLLIGGADMRAQITGLMRRPRIIVGTPGRVIDHLKRGTLMLGQTNFVVLDETDRMLDMGFAPQLDEIQRFLPKENKQTLMFSATYPANIKQMAAKYLRSPVRISTGSVSKPIDTIKQLVIHTTNHKKQEDLINVLTTHVGSVVVFVKTRRDADKVSDQLEGLGHLCKAIHGDRSQSQRQRTIDGFRRGKFPILVATDVAARGLDVPQITLVVNYDLPQNPEDYIHRIGRTGRAGAEGTALTLLTNDDIRQWREIVKLISTNNGDGSATQHIATQSGVVSAEEYAASGARSAKKPARSGFGGPRRSSSNSQRAQDYVSNIGSKSGGGNSYGGGNGGGGRNSSGNAGGGNSNVKEFGERRASRNANSNGAGAGAGAGRRSGGGNAAGGGRKFYGQRTSA